MRRARVGVEAAGEGRRFERNSRVLKAPTKFELKVVGLNPA